MKVAKVGYDHVDVPLNVHVSIFSTGEEIFELLTHCINRLNVIYSKHSLIRTSGLRTSRQKFAALILKNTRTCLAKQDQTGS